MKRRLRQQLIFRAIDGLLDERQFEEFQGLLESDKSFRQEYLFAISLTHVLEEKAAASRDGDIRDFAYLRSPRRLRWNAAHITFTLATVVIALLSIFGYLLAFPKLRPQVSGDGVQPVAWIDQRIDCVIPGDKWTNNQSSKFFANDSIRVDHGVLVVEFVSGAKVAIEGPAVLDLLGGNEAFLRTGQLTATVPERAHGFEIITPNSKVIDHGTEFGVSVNEEGETETYVFEGKVELV